MRARSSNRAASLVRRACAPQTVLEGAGEELRRRSLRRRFGRAHGSLVRAMGVSGPRRRLRRLQEKVASGEGIDGLPRGERLESVAEVVVVAPDARDLDAQLECGAIHGVDRARSHHVLQRGCGVARGERGAAGPQLELVALPGVALERRCPAPQRCRAPVLAAPLEQVREVPQRAGAARPLCEQEAELVARVLHTSEALLEDRRAAQPHGAKHLLLLRLPAQAIGASREVVRELVVLARARRSPPRPRDRPPRPPGPGRARAARLARWHRRRRSARARAPGA